MLPDKIFDLVKIGILFEPDFLVVILINVTIM